MQKLETGNIGIGNTSTFPHSTRKEEPMKPIARMILVSSLVREGRGNEKGEVK